MSNALKRKVFAGAQIRRLRRERRLTQAAMAAELGVSASYLNLIEANQRPLTAQLVLKLAERYDADLRVLGEEEGARAVGNLREVFADPLLQNIEIARQDLADLADTAPAAAEAILALYRAYRQAQEDNAGLASRLAGGEDRAHNLTVGFPVDEVRQLLQEHRNHFPVLDAGAEAIAKEAGLGIDDNLAPLRERLSARHGIAVRVLPVGVMGGVLRRFDRHRRQLQISELVDHAGRAFQSSFQLGLIAAGREMDLRGEE